MVVCLVPCRTPNCGQRCSDLRIVGGLKIGGRLRNESDFGTVARNNGYRQLGNISYQSLIERNFIINKLGELYQTRCYYSFSMREKILAELCIHEVINSSQA